MTRARIYVVSLILLLAADTLKAQTDAAVASGIFGAAGEPPVPQIASISTLPETITLGETFDLEVLAENAGGLADNGTISVSFPDLNDPGDAQFVNVKPGTSDDLPGDSKTPKGQSVLHRDGTTKTASYLLAEFEDDHWEASETNLLVLGIEPQQVGTFVIQIRVTMQKIVDSYNDPSSGETDQQGWEVTRRTITVIAAPEISVSPPSQDYGAVTVDSSASRLFTIENIGGGTLAGRATIGDGRSQYTIGSGGGNYSLSAGQTRTVVVQFTPTASGSQNGTLRVTHDGSNFGSPIEAELKGAGIVQPQVAFSPSSHEFGTIIVGEDSSQVFEVANTGNELLEGVVSISSGESHYSIMSGGGNYSLPVGQLMQIVVRFAPQSAGRQTGNLHLTHNGTNPASPTTIPLTGTGLRLAEITLAPRSHDFGTIEVGDDSAHVFMVSNSGGGRLSGVISVSPNAGSFSIESGSGSYSLAPGETKSVKVLYTPGGSGSHTGALRVTHNDPSTETPAEATLVGSALNPPRAAIEPAALDFGTVTLGSDSSMTLEITNTGDATLSLAVALDSDSDDYSITSGEGTIELPGANALVVTVRFSPSSDGPTSGLLWILHNGVDPESPARVVLSGLGVVAPPDVTMEISLESDTLDFDELDPGENTATLTIGNLGPDTLRGFIELSDLSGKVMTAEQVMADSSFIIASGGGAFVLAPDEVHEVVVSFEPVGEGQHEATLLIAHNASNLLSPTRIHVRGTGSAPVAVENETRHAAFALLPSFPNPAMNHTQITFVLSQPGHTRLTLYDILGREVALVVDEKILAGQSTFRFSTAALPAGRYLMRLQAGDLSASQIVLVGSRVSP